MTGRVDEAMDLYKSLCDEIGKERMDPEAIISFAEIMEDNHENPRALEILEEYLEAIKRSWGKREQGIAYEMIARLYRRKNQSTLIQLYVSQDWAGLLELDSEMIATANSMANKYPSYAGSINFYLGRAHLEMGLEGGIEQASLYYKKSIEMAKKAGNNENLPKCVILLSQCYAQMDRVEEAMDLYKSLCDEIGKERMDPDNILPFAQTLMNNHEPSHALEILEEHLEIIESSWENQNQSIAYEIIARIYLGKNAFAKSNVYFERQLSIAKEIKDLESEALALLRPHATVDTWETMATPWHTWNRLW